MQRGTDGALVDVDPSGASAVVGALYDGDDRTSPVDLPALRADVLGTTVAADGSGIDVALIDTGVARVDGLADGNVVDGPDFTVEALTTAAGVDTNGHGTHMAGIIAGNRIGAAGIAPGARIVNVKVADRSGDVSTAQLVAAIEWVIANRSGDGLNIRVLHVACSNPHLAGTPGDPLVAAVQRAWDAGIVVVVAAGNDGATLGQLASPAVNPYVIAVGSSDSTARHEGPQQPVPAWSAVGDGVRNPDLVAPGRSIASYRVPGSDADDTSPEGRFGADLFLGSGTSQSAAVVSGLVAVLLEAHPELSNDEVKSTLIAASSTELDLPATVIGAGVVDGAAAVANPAVGTPPQDHDRPAWAIFLEPPASLSGNGWTGNGWTGNGWTGNGWTGNGWTGNGWTGNGWTGNGWTGNGWT